MRQFDVVKNRGASGFPYVVVLQHGLLSALNTRLVAPLAPASRVRTPLQRLNPVVNVEGRKFVALVHLAGAARVARLGAVVANLEARRAELLAAVEVVLGGV